MSLNLTKEEEQLIKKLRTEKAAAEKTAAFKLIVRGVDDYTTKEKEQKFKEFHTMASEIWNEAKVKGVYDYSDCSNFLFEKIMELLMPQKMTASEFWDTFNKMCD